MSTLSSLLHHLNLPPPSSDTINSLLSFLTNDLPTSSDKPTLIKLQTLQIHTLTSLKLNPLKLYVNDHDEIAKLARYCLDCTKEGEGEKRKELWSVSETARVQIEIANVRKEVGKGTEEGAEMWEGWGREEKLRVKHIQMLSSD